MIAVLSRWTERVDRKRSERKRQRRTDSLNLWWKKFCLPQSLMKEIFDCALVRNGCGTTCIVLLLEYSNGRWRLEKENCKPPCSYKISFVKIKVQIKIPLALLNFLFLDTNLGEILKFHYCKISKSKSNIISQSLWYVDSKYLLSLENLS